MNTSISLDADHEYQDVEYFVEYAPTNDEWSVFVTSIDRVAAKDCDPELVRTVEEVLNQKYSRDWSLKNDR